MIEVLYIFLKQPCHLLVLKKKKLSSYRPVTISDCLVLKKKRQPHAVIKDYKNKQ